ncbi:histone deacetylase family protein [Acuticoccus sp.]|uniref:histone deacetylase family protein n=1 Tax=Acuticoccus sp. TaxID=1904378 RepID=UPI003B5248F2
MTLIYIDPLFAEHATPRGHPERAERHVAVLAALDGDGTAAIPRRTAAAASYAAITAVHPSSHVDKLLAAVPSSGHIAIDADTTMAPRTMDAALLASGSAIAAVDAVLSGAAANAFVAARPPGHHAERSRAMGFCFINHVAIAARHAQRAHGVGRVAIVDFDVHHGNGTQDAFWDDPSVLYVSTHQSPLYPGTGEASERGAGNILNVPLAPGTSGPAYRSAFDGTVMPALTEFAPELLILSAGFDAHAHDPLGGLLLTDEDFVWITERMMDLATTSCEGRMVSCLEGGYDLSALGRCVAAHVATLATH